MKRLVVLASLLLLTACDPFEGVLSVKYPFAVKGDSTVVVQAGDFNAKLEFSSSKKIDITLKVNGKKQNITLNLPKKLNIPDNGPFTVSAADLGQDFSAQGANTKTMSDSQMQSGNEQCTYQRHEQVCYPVNNQIVCRDEIRTVYGWRYVEYFDRTTTQNLNVNFIHANGATLANFNGQKSSVERFYRTQDMCR
jgi:hypothetical protein